MFRVRCRFRCLKPLLVTNNEAATHLYRIAQEAVHNAVRHGQARQITISLAFSAKRVRLRVVDDGTGIKTLSPRRKGLGLRIMQYRAGLLAGVVSVQARPEGGTDVSCTTPVQTLCSDEGALKRNSNSRAQR